MQITKVGTRDARYKLKGGAGSDAVHTDPTYAYAVTLLESRQVEREYGLDTQCLERVHGHRQRPNRQRCTPILAIRRILSER